MTKTFWFNSGVKPWNSSYLAPGDKYINNENHIPFDCDDVPDGATFAFGAQVDNLEGYENYIVRKMKNTTMGSEYAYFKPPYKPDN